MGIYGTFNNVQVPHANIEFVVNLECLYELSDWDTNQMTKPPNWNVPVWQLDTADSNNNGYENEDLIVWMRTAALPTFRKLYRRVNHTATFSDGLPAGQYQIDIEYSEC